MEPVKVIMAPRRSEVRTLWQGVRVLEDRFVHLQERLARGGLGEQEFLESADIILGVQRVYRELKDESGRRNLRFAAEQQLSRLDEWCRWLVRKVAEEVFFRARLDLEQTLRTMLSPDAYRVYLRMTELEDMAQEITALSDTALADQLWQGELAPMLIDQLHGLPPLPPSDNETTPS